MCFAQINRVFGGELNEYVCNFESVLSIFRVFVMQSIFPWGYFFQVPLIGFFFR